MALSITQAFHKKQSGDISWDEYIRILLARLTGVRYAEDGVKGSHSRLRYLDPFGHMIWSWSNRMDKVEDTSPFEAVFEAYRHGTLKDINGKFELFKEKAPAHGVKGMKKCLALLSCQERRADVLKWCLDLGGFPIEATMADEADNVDATKDPETFEVLQQSPKFQAIRAMEEENKARAGGVCKFDRGGTLPVDW